MKKTVVTATVGNKEISIETGELAKQANGSVIVTSGDTVVLVTATAAKNASEFLDFLPLTVNYQEQAYSAGKIPGGFFKREGKPSDREVLASRVIDRTLRPLFNNGYSHETQVIATVLSYGENFDPVALSVLGASAALYISDIPYEMPVGALKVGRIDGEFKPDFTGETEKADIDITVSASKESIVMVEGGAEFVSEGEILEALNFAYDNIQPLIRIQEELREKVGKEKQKVDIVELDEEIKNKIVEEYTAKLDEAFAIKDKLRRNSKLDTIREEILEKYAGDDEGLNFLIKGYFEELIKSILRKKVKTGVRIDGRKLDEIRPITIKTGVLPRTHGSAVFTRGETQALVVTTLGTSDDEQLIDSLVGEHYKKFMLHYNFPPFSVGEVRFLRGPGRREIGHGNLAERAIRQIIPLSESFPYTIRIVSDILESNGSSSMATVCGASLSLMDAGVPVKNDVAGIAMGLIKEDDDFIILTDILGDEDHLGDMDFKVAGSETGISAIQMDIKIKGIGSDVLEKALNQAKEGRLFILSKMREVISKPKDELSRFAPRYYTLKIDPNKIREVIGPGGKVIRNIVKETGADIDIKEDGQVNIFSTSKENLDKALDMVKEIVREVEIGETYNSKVKKITNFGAFVELIPGVEGLVHISQLALERVNKVEDVVKEGDFIKVKVVGKDEKGRLKLSRKEVLKEENEKKD